jgi:hypothetical protein
MIYESFNSKKGGTLQQSLVITWSACGGGARYCAGHLARGSVSHKLATKNGNSYNILEGGGVGIAQSL